MGQQDFLASLQILRENVDGFFVRTQERYGSRMQCRAGCSACCQVDLSVFPIEAEAIRKWFSELPAAEQERLREIWRAPNAAPGPNAAGEEHPPCAFLHNGQCTIYPARPIICRSQGLPLMFKVVSKAETKVSVDACPLNFDAGRNLPPQGEWLDLERLNTLLAIVARSFSESGERVPLRELRRSLS